MYRIRSEQFADLRWRLLQPQRERFVVRLRHRLPHRVQGFTDEQLHILCDLGIAKANDRGLTAWGNVYSFIGAMVVLGQDFDIAPDKPWLNDVFGDPSMDEDLKARLLQMRVRIETSEDVTPDGF